VQINLATTEADERIGHARRLEHAAGAAVKRALAADS
jgi:hypothetical protein